MKKTFALVIASLFFTSGCVSLDVKEFTKSRYNVPSSGVSEFDGTRFIRIENISCPGDERDTSIFFDIYQDSKQKEINISTLKLKLVGLHSIPTGESLHFNIDGDIISLKTRDITTDFEEIYESIYSPGYAGGGTYLSPIYVPATKASTKRYPISEDTIKRIGDADRVVVKVELSRSYFEGICSPQDHGWDESMEWFKKLSGTEGFKSFHEMQNNF